VFRKMLRLAHAEKRNLFETERAALGYTHAEVGAGLAERWGLPAELAEAVRCHHEPGLAAASEPVRMNLAIHASNVTCQGRELGYGDAPASDPAVWGRSLEGLGIPARAMELIADEVVKQVSVMETDGWF